MNYYDLFGKKHSREWNGSEEGTRSLVCCAIGEVDLGWHAYVENWGEEETLEEECDRLEGQIRAYQGYMARYTNHPNLIADYVRTIETFEKRLKEVLKEIEERGPEPEKPQRNVVEEAIKDGLENNYSFLIFACAKNTESWDFKDEIEGLPNIQFIGEEKNPRGNVVRMYVLNLKQEI